MTTAREIRCILADERLTLARRARDDAETNYATADHEFRAAWGGLTVAQQERLTGLLRELAFDEEQR